MLVVFDIRREQVIHLVPEHCRFIGLTDEIVEDFKAFREVRFSRRTDAPVKIKESTQFVNMLQQHEKVLTRMQAWSFFIDPHVVEFPGFKYDAGNVLMGHKARSTSLAPQDDRSERLKFSIEQSGKDLGLALTKNKLFD